ncbi:MAG: methyltransferase domain-containing protein [bacterium]
MIANTRHLLKEIYANTALHHEVHEIIQKQSTNPEDIREEALEGLNLISASKILDLGCAFGFFTRALGNRIDPDSMITGIDHTKAYRHDFLESCHSIGVKGYFYGTGVEKVYALPDDAFDLVLSSYSIYFFPDILPEIRRILKPEGHFVIISHATNHAGECIRFIMETFQEMEIVQPSFFPYQELVSRFNDNNGKQILSRWFDEVVMKEHRSALLFRPEDFQSLKRYFQFKKPYYIPGDSKNSQRIANKALERLKALLDQGKSFRVTKDDVIFVCTKPRKNVR